MIASPSIFATTLTDKRYNRKGQARVRPGYRSRLQVQARACFHDLRHTCASHLVMGSWGRIWSLEEVRDFLGHTDVRVTQRYAPT